MYIKKYKVDSKLNKKVTDERKYMANILYILINIIVDVIVIRRQLRWITSERLNNSRAKDIWKKTR